MKRLQSIRQVLRLLVASIAAMLVGLAFSATAQAVPSAAPKITTTPANPNTTQAVVTFKYTVGDGETSTVSPLRYYCRVYNADVAPPAAGTGWAACGLSTDPQPLSKTYAQANGNWKFEVAARETTAIGTQGPIGSFSWTHNIAAPSLAPVITSEPADPTADLSSDFKYKGGVGEEALVDRAQCRLDSNDSGPWTACAATGVGYYPGNGQHTFQVRVGNLQGYGAPSEVITWTVAVPNPQPSLPVTEVASSIWNGTTSNTSKDRLSAIGDFNGDGRDDMAHRQTGSSDIVFGSAGDIGSRMFGTQNPTEGFRILPTTGEQIDLVKAAGDQNGDGVGDLLLRETSPPFGTGPRTHYVVYGGLSIEDLPACPSGPARCLSPATMTTGQGYKITSSVNVSGSENGELYGDYDGDGTDDLFLSRGTNSGQYLVIKGMERSGSANIQSLPASELTIINGVPSSGAGVGGLGDLDGDGREDVFLKDGASGTSKVLYGRAFGEGTFDLTSMASEDGFGIFSPNLSGLNVAPVGDIDGDGLPEIAASLTTGLDLDDAVRTVAIYDVPQRGSSDFLLVGEDMDPESGYVVNRGGPNTSALGETRAETLGDINNDGPADALISAPSTPVDGFGESGAAYVLFGQDPKPAAPIGVGPSLTSDIGVGLTGPPGSKLGASIAPLGDLDDDGLADFAVLATGAKPGGVANAGSTYIVLGKKLINQVKTGNAAAVSNDSTVLNAGVSTNNRGTDVHFEYGESAAYGATTEDESFEASATGDGASAAIDGLEKNTTYHYRAVATNELGLTRYGDDRTFTTTNTTPPDGPSPCVADPSKPGCADYCKANSAAMGCPDYDWCAANPGKCSGGGGNNTNAKLTMIASPKTVKVKRGKKGSFATIVVNSGGKKANGVKICVKAPKRFVKVKKCQTLGGLGSGATKTRTIKVKVKKKAKKGKKLSLKFTASAKGLGSRKATARIKVK